jgi:hypothetical protein
MPKTIGITIALLILFSTPSFAEPYMDDSESWNHGFKNSGIEGHVYFINPRETVMWAAQADCVDILEEAKAMKQDLIDMGYRNAAIQLSRNSVGDLFYPVIIGIYDTKQEALNAAVQIKDIYKNARAKTYQGCYFEKKDGSIVFTHPYRERGSPSDLTGHFVD